MKSIFAFMGFLLVVSTGFAGPIVECKGTSVLDASPALAKIFFYAGFGRIAIRTDQGSFESSTEVNFFSNSTLEIYDNSFKMYFLVSPTKPASQVQAFRNGVMIVGDFRCVDMRASSRHR